MKSYNITIIDENYEEFKFWTNDLESFYDSLDENCKVIKLEKKK